MKVARDFKSLDKRFPPFVFLFRPEGGEKDMGGFGVCLPGTQVPGKTRPPSGRRRPGRPATVRPRVRQTRQPFPKDIPPR